MCLKYVAILTQHEDWFLPYASNFVNELISKGYHAKVFHSYDDIGLEYEVVFILSFYSLIDLEKLRRHKHNIVVHESDLPMGKGWSPLVWQILDGSNRIPVSVFEADEGMDSGDIYFKDEIKLNGDELYDEIRAIQANKKIECCSLFLENYQFFKKNKQSGESTFYQRRFPSDSELNIDSTILSQFNLLRCASNEDFPAFFLYRGVKYVLKIYKEPGEN